MPVTLIVGGVRGLGRAAAEALVEAGHEVHVTWRRSREEAERLARRWPGRVWALDLDEPEPGQSLIAKLAAERGGLDHLVVAAGDFLSGSLEDLSAAEFEGLWRSNVAQPLALFGAARPFLRARRGSALFFGCAGLEGHPGKRRSAAYAACKSALLSLVRSLALEEGPQGLRVNLVSPGWIPHASAHPETLSRAGQVQIPLGRPGLPEEVARAVVFLLGPGAAYVSGANLSVSGGL
jgi:NAD(P)-dependent dehydrogenase (short-subunit alcohol dehydrogenase family)